MQLIGAIREVRQHAATVETAKAVLWLAAALGKKR